MTPTGTPSTAARWASWTTTERRSRWRSCGVASDPNAADDEAVDAAVRDLIGMTEVVDVEISGEGAYHELQTGEYAIRQAWSGDVLAAKRFGPGTEETLANTGYVWPSGGIVGCDLMAVCANGRNPVLAHAFIDHLLREEVALDNFAWNGYQPPVGLATPRRSATRRSPGDRLVPEHLRVALLDARGPRHRSVPAALPPEDGEVWRAGWERFRDAVGDERSSRYAWCPLRSWLDHDRGNPRARRQPSAHGLEGGEAARASRPVVASTPCT